LTTTLRMTLQPYGTTPAVTIEVDSTNFEAVQSLNIGSQSTGSGAGKVAFGPFTFTKKPDINSPDLWTRLCSGTPFLKVSVSAAVDSTSAPFFTFTMGLVAVKTIAFSASKGDGSPLETITLQYGQSAYSVTPQNPDGTLGTPVTAGWDGIRNVAMDPTKIGVV
jgi:type VI protein secretion system component Hcp